VASLLLSRVRRSPRSPRRLRGPVRRGLCPAGGDRGRDDETLGRRLCLLELFPRAGSIAGGRPVLHGGGRAPRQRRGRRGGGDAYWRRLGAPADVIGRTVVLNARPVTIVAWRLPAFAARWRWLPESSGCRSARRA
jgi:hypothetical protein